MSETMKTLKKQRAVLRSSISKGSNNIHGLAEKDQLDVDDLAELRSMMDVLNRRHQELVSKDEEMMSGMLNDEEYTEEQLEEEQTKVDEYELLFCKAKRVAERFLVPSNTTDDNDSVRSFESCKTSHTHKYKLPTLKLKEFDGQLENWLPFWAQFERIDKDESMANVDKLGYLVMSMTIGSPASQLVQSYPGTADMYPEIVKALKARFGREDLLTEFYMKELLKIILQNMNSEISVAELYDTLQCHLRNLETLGVGAENYSSILMPLVSSCLPQDLLKLWERQVKTTNPNVSSKDYLQSLMLFIKGEVESTQKLNLAEAGFGLPDHSQETTATAATLVAIEIQVVFFDGSGITDPTNKMLRTEIDQATEEHFISNVKMNDEDRFEIRLPFMENHPPVSDYYQVALKRLSSVTKKLDRDLIFKDYEDVLDGWEKLGIIEEVPAAEVDKPAHHLPHHKVIKVDFTAPGRPVFDVSAKEIVRDLTKEFEWRHVADTMNSADKPSQESSVKKLIQLRWWEGHAWLKEPPDRWPQPKVKYDKEEVNSKRKEVSCIHGRFLCGKIFVS